VSDDHATDNVTAKRAAPAAFPESVAPIANAAPAPARRTIPIIASGTIGSGTAKLVSMYQKHQTIHPRSVQGWFQNWRWVFVWLTQAVFYGLPWLQIHGRQAMLFDLAARRFYIFGIVLYPQDLVYLTGLLVISALSLFLFTAIAGRLWCGFACPQTVYSEIFLWVEKKIEGDRRLRQKLDAAPWDARKIALRSAKHGAWIAIALWTGYTFVGYFTPIRVLASEAAALTFGPWEWFWVFFYAFATYGNAGFLREQVCKYMCPYARFQSAMFDRDTMIVAYDTGRGEPRGTRARSADLVQANLGHCIDCNLCVEVCPTGIDIRKGLQYECIGCAACVDACNRVMDKMHYPRGLIRFATENGLERHWSRREMLLHVVRPRVLIYTSLLGFITFALGASLWLRAPFRVDVVRDRASLGRVLDDGSLENVYRLQVMNATEASHRFRIGVSGLEGVRVAGLPDVQLEGTQAAWVAVDVRLPPATANDARPGAHPIQFRIQRLADDGTPDATVVEKSTFLVPR